MENDIKMPKWATRSWILGCTHVAYKTKGFVYAVKTFFNVSLVEIFRWFYNNCKPFRNFIRNRAKKQGEINLFLLEFFMIKGPIDVDYWCDRLSKLNTK